MKTSIELKNMRFFAHHGVLPQERVIGNEFVVNLKLETDFSIACKTDEVEDTLNYAHIFDLVKAEMQTPSNLLEHVAGRILRKIRETYPNLGAIEIRVAKMYPPVSGEAEMAEVVIND